MISRVQMICLAVLVCGDILLAVATVWLLPDRVPVHWNFRGEIDRYGSPWELAFILPGFVLASTGLLIALPAMGNFGASLHASKTTYGRMAIAVVAALVGIHVLMVVLGRHHALDIGSAMMADLGVLLIVLGNWTSKLRRNPMAGIRTPWTLKSDFIWERTNRVGGRLQVAHGLVVLLSALLLPIWAAIAVLMGGLLGLVTWAMVYSWRLDRATRTAQ